MPGYFEVGIEQLDLNVKSDEADEGLRLCQIGAYWAVRSHFTAWNTPALVSLPTGAGKTALMMLLAFGLEARRVLVVTPTDVLRTQTYGKFANLDGLIQAGVLAPDCQNPMVHRLTGRVTSLESWQQMEAYDVVVTLPNNISPEYNRDDLDDIVPPPDGFFDLVFFDEAHYMRAPSWRVLLDLFEGTKCVLLTATPFRRDRKAIPGQLVYFYPLRRAMAAGIYSPVRFESVRPGLEHFRDEALSIRAIDVLAELRAHHDASMLIRTDRIDKAEQLQRLYRARGVTVEAIHSQRSPLQNESALAGLRGGELDGVVAVGQLGEGLDIANLKIVVFHEPPKSFPFTIQLVGRITRPIQDGELTACVVADPDQLRQSGVADEVRRLYLEDVAWRDLIPQLVDEFAGDLVRDGAPGSYEMVLNADPDDLSPYLSARLYRIGPEQVNFDALLDLGESYRVHPLPQAEDTVYLGLITQTSQAPSWARNTSLQTTRLDLHLYYYHDRARTLFECTTSDAIAAKIREAVLTEPWERLGGEELVRVMHSEQAMDYLVAGLANALGPSGALPSYKMLLGREVQGAVNPSDRRVFTRGHVVARMADGETRGISDGQGRVWSMKRGTLQEFVDWCERIGDALIDNAAVDTAQGLEFVGGSQRVRQFPAIPLLALMNPTMVPLAVYVEHPAWGEPVILDASSFSVGEFVTENQEAIELTFFPSPDVEPMQLVYAIDSDRWEVLADEGHRAIVDSGSSRDSYSLPELFREFPPYFYLSNGSIVAAGRVQRPRLDYGHLPGSCLVEGLDWSACDTTVEYGVPAPDRISVQDWLRRKLIDELPENAVAYRDHGRGESADYAVWNLDLRRVELYHCKAASKVSREGPRKGQPDIGATLDHVKEALDQVLRSVVWIKSRRLVDHIAERYERDNQTGFVMGEGLFGGLRANFTPAYWSYCVYLVNPGLDQRRIVENDNVDLVLLSCYEWLRGIDCEFRIMGYDSELVE